ncbi:O-acetyltransferase [Mrakia frigida]|uniref:O-acetyltransferase n=1 Tax=Mrakia frigida TaxID=29902 RepID=UPI003FCC1F5F
MPPSSPKSKSTLNPNWPQYACVATICVAFVAAMMRYFVIDFGDRYHCKALLSTGQWMDNDFKQWQPDGCMTNNYNPTQIQTCLPSRRLVFIGDSITRQLFYSMAKLADPTAPDGPPEGGGKHMDQVWKSAKGGLEFQFFWDPFLNTTHTQTFLSNPHIPVPSYTPAHPPQPALLILGSGLWYLRHPTSGGLATWESRIDSTFSLISQSSSAKGQLGGGLLADEIIFLPILEPVQSLLSPERKDTLNHGDIDAMNSDLAARLSPDPSFLYSSTSSTKSSSSSARAAPPPISLPVAFNALLDPSQTTDGLHFSTKILNTQAQILYNLRCNDVLPKKFPMDKTCCKKYPVVNWLQALVLFVVIAWVPTGRLMQSKLAPYPRLASLFPTDDNLVLTLTIFGLCTGLTFFADRTGLWSKENKVYDAWTFGLALMGALAVGLGTCKRSEGGKDLGFLNREQTDEWKGWMQIIILVYHYQGASKISGIYNPVRVLVAAYLFMTGYGHFTFYLKKADFGMARIAMVMVRLNLLPIVLAYTMDTDYISYYFSPLVSFWYLIIYSTMLIGSKYNDNPVFLLPKLVVSLLLVTWFMKTTWILQSIFNFLGAVANIQWSAKEWSFRVNLDLFVVYLGMFTAYAYIKLKELGIPNLPWFPTAVKGSVGASIGAMVWFFWFQLSRESKFVYNVYHPVVSFIPILAFVVLRNATPFLRSVNSRLFCFIGQISLETFILQFHVWLAADTKGILIVVPGTRWRYVNIVVSTIIFVYISQKMSQATGQLTEFLVGKSKKPKGLPTTAAAAPVPVVVASSSQEDPTAKEGEEGIPLLETNSNSNPNDPSSSSSTSQQPSNSWVDVLPPSVSSKAKGSLDGWKESPGLKLLAMVVFCWGLNLLSRLGR